MNNRLVNRMRSKEHPPYTSMASREEDPTNGLVFKGVYIPEEVLVLILSNVDVKTLVKCRFVCKQWHEVLSGPVWHAKASAEIPQMNALFFRHHKLLWVDLYWLCQKKPFHRNMIKNSCGENKFKHWTMTNSGDGWEIERAPTGCDPFPKDFSSCFVTSYGKCSAEQLIDLRKEGLTENFMDGVNPEITVSDWYVGRWDCGIEYKISVSLLNSNWEVLNSFNFEDRLVDQEKRNNWKNVKHTFKKYGKGVQYVQFYHCGTDTQFWAGHYGAKMTGAEVTISLPHESSSSPKDEEDSDWMTVSVTNSSQSSFNSFMYYSSGDSLSSTDD